MNTKKLREAAKCVFLAAEEKVAQDISDKLIWASNKIDRLNSQLDAQQGNSTDNLEEPVFECLQCHIMLYRHQVQDHKCCYKYSGIGTAIPRLCRRSRLL